MVRETTGFAREVVQVAPPVAVTAATHLDTYHAFMNQVGLFLDPLLKLVTIVYTIMMAVNMTKKWHNNRRRHED